MKHSINDHYTPTSYADGQSRLEARMMDGRTRYPGQIESMDMTTFSDMERQLDGTISPSELGRLDNYMISRKSAKLKREALAEVTEKKYDEIKKLVCEAIESQAQQLRHKLKAQFNRQFSSISTQANTSLNEALLQIQLVQIQGQLRLVNEEHAISEQIERMYHNGMLTPEKYEWLMQLLRDTFTMLGNEYKNIALETQDVVINAYSSNK